MTVHKLNLANLLPGLPPPFNASASSSDERSKASNKGEEAEEEEEEEDEEDGEKSVTKTKGRKDDEDDEDAGGLKGAKKRPATRKGGGGTDFQQSALSRWWLGVAKKPAKRTVEKKKGPKRTKKNESGEACSGHRYRRMDLKHPVAL